MNGQTTRQSERIRPYFTEQQAKESVEKKPRFALRRREIEWVSSIPLYLPYWLVNVEMDLREPGKKGLVQRLYTIMVNGMNNRGLTVRGELLTDRGEVRGIYLENETSPEKVKETGRLEALTGSKRMINPPPHRVKDDTRLIYYPLALVRLRVDGKEEVQVFDYYRGGLDKYMMRYLNLKDRLEEKRKTG